MAAGTQPSYSAGNSNHLRNELDLVKKHGILIAPAALVHSDIYILEAEGIKCGSLSSVFARATGHEDAFIKPFSYVADPHRAWVYYAPAETEEKTDMQLKRYFGKYFERTSTSKMLESLLPSGVPFNLNRFKFVGVIPYDVTEAMQPRRRA